MAKWPDVQSFATLSLIHHLINHYGEELGYLMGERSRGQRQVLKRFINGVAERLSARRTAAYFERRAARADVARALDLLDRAGDQPPREGDELAG